MKLLIRLWNQLERKRKTQLFGISILMIIASFAEVASIGAIFPFLGILTTPDSVFAYPGFQSFIKFINIKQPEELLLPITIIFISAVLLSAAIRLFLLWTMTKFSFAIGADFSLDIYRRTLYQPYVIHLSRNSSEIIDGVSVKTNNVIYNVILPCLTLISSTFMVVFILTALYFIAPEVALISFGAFGLLYVFIVVFTKKRVLRDGEKVAVYSAQLIKFLQEGLGGIKDILLDNTQEVFCHSYQKTDRELRAAQASNLFISQSPRFAIEALGMTFIALIAFGMYMKSDGTVMAIPVLGAFALGAQRLLPVLQQSFYSWTNIRGMQATLEQLLELLIQPLPALTLSSPRGSMVFEGHIRLSEISYSYNSGPRILEQINLVIPKGSRVGFIGKTGSGKSTLLDIVMGLLDPDQGKLLVDDIPINAKNKRSWQAKIAHVPQFIFLADSSIAENIAFGIDKNLIDFKRVEYVAELAQISHTILSMPSGFSTVIGERGVRLSGGQRQRLGIARALYKQADVIVLDEATSALDNDTEESLMNALKALDRKITVLMIAHRLTTLKDCDMLVELTSSGDVRIRNYHEII
jgi:ATP-binding cassette subfamily B protein